jgi:NADPH-dependent F420 reductase
VSEEGSIAVIGGAGNLGAALAYRLALAGHAVILGSRSVERARVAAERIGHGVQALANEAAAAAAGIVIVTVPFEAQEATLLAIRPHVTGKIVVDTTVPLMPPRVMRVQLPPEGSAAERAQKLLGDGVEVVSAFHNVAADKLATAADVDCDVLVFGNSRAARAQIVELASAAGLRALHAGPLANSAAAEAMTSVLIFINRNYGANGAGLRITGTLKAFSQAPGSR